MGLVLRQLLTRSLPTRLAWVVAAFATAKPLIGRQDGTDGPRVPGSTRS